MGNVNRCSTKHIERDGAYLLWGYPRLQGLLYKLVEIIDLENGDIEKRSNYQLSESNSRLPTTEKFVTMRSARLSRGRSHQIAT